MQHFTVEQSNLMCIYGGDTRQEVINNLLTLKKVLEHDEVDLIELTEKTIKLLNDISDEVFEEARAELVPDFS